MKIKEIWFKNNRHRWELERTTFSDLTLLVGASGVGKTKILNVIMRLINISKGYAYNGIEWDFHFAADEDEDYRWTGEFESIKEIEQREFKEEEISGNGGLQKIPKLLNEKLYLDDKLVFERKESNVKYENKKTPKISPHTSLLSLFTKEDKISPIKKSFEKIMLLDYGNEKIVRINASLLKKLTELFMKDIQKLQKKVKKVIPKNVSKKGKEIIGKFIRSEEFTGLLPLKETRNINTFILFKLAIMWVNYRAQFEKIVLEFKDIFPQVEDIQFKLLEEQDVYELQIKERGTDWISRSEISFGMFKTLMHIAEMKLLADGYVVLIDEFENSLGVNCIDEVSAGLVNPGRDLQYIITSHHPYIINNIDMKYWKVVMRKGAKVFTKNADQLKLGKSKHEAFKQLLNLEEFAEGIS